MPKLAISKRSVDAIKPPDTETTYWDDKLTGFGLKATPAGGKIYVYRYRLARPGLAAQTPPKKFTINKHGSITPDQAREIARELAAMVAAGIDPREFEAEKFAAKDRAKLEAEERARSAKELAFDAVAEAWLEYYENAQGRRANSVTQAKLAVRRHLEPTLGEKPLPDITRANIQAIIDGIPAAQKGARRSTYTYASVFFNWATRRQLIDKNPLVGMEKPQAPRARDRVLDDDELAHVWSATQGARAPFGSFYRLLILTGQRREEIAAMRWEEIDREAATWVIPRERAKNDTVHLVPLSALVIAELDNLAGGDHEWPRAGFVLTTTGRNPISGFSKAKRLIDVRVTKERGGEPLLDWRVHDLRRTVATGFQRLGVRFEVTEAILNHVSGSRGGVAGIYQRHDWKQEKRSALDAWAEHVKLIVKPSQTDNVVALRPKRSARE